jgi:hypothetical protein
VWKSGGQLVAQVSKAHPSMIRKASARSRRVSTHAGVGEPAEFSAVFSPTDQASPDQLNASWRWCPAEFEERRDLLARLDCSHDTPLGGWLWPQLPRRAGLRRSPCRDGQNGITWHLCAGDAVRPHGVCALAGRTFEGRPHPSGRAARPAGGTCGGRH